MKCCHPVLWEMQTFWEEQHHYGKTNTKSAERWEKLVNCPIQGICSSDWISQCFYFTEPLVYLISPSTEANSYTCTKITCLCTLWYYLQVLSQALHRHREIQNVKLCKNTTFSTFLTGKKRLIKKSMAKLRWNTCHKKIELVSNLLSISFSRQMVGFSNSSALR